MSDDEAISHIILNNKTDLPFNVLTFKKILDGMSSLESEIIGPNKEKLLNNSITGEWYLEIPSDDNFTKWIEKGLKRGYEEPNDVYIHIGKFRSEPCITGEYCWITGTNIFLCEHTTDSETGIGMVTISYNMDAPFFKNQEQNL